VYVSKGSARQVSRIQDLSNGTWQGFPNKVMPGIFGFADDRGRSQSESDSESRVYMGSTKSASRDLPRQRHTAVL
jgi:hypothetical protein